MNKDHLLTVTRARQVLPAAHKETIPKPAALPVDQVKPSPRSKVERPRPVKRPKARTRREPLFVPWAWITLLCAVGFVVLWLIGLNADPRKIQPVVAAFAQFVGVSPPFLCAACSSVGLWIGGVALWAAPWLMTGRNWEDAPKR